MTSNFGMVTRVLSRGLEVLGELVMASDEECALVENGVIDYKFIENALSFVNTPAV